ncbi:MAG: RNA-binding protein [Planctomycetota bacterium]|nr:MAG: RNA-binding protein [Planctomycetota bacterium]
MKNIYVGNLPFQTDEQELRTLFESYGEVSRATIICDRDTGRPRGFGFVEMPNDQAGDKAIEALNGSDLGGRNLTVNEARPRQPRQRRGGGGGRW